MKKWFLVCLMCVTPWALADGHSDLGLEKRQPDTAMNVTSVKLGQDVTSVSAEGDMDGYGKVYVTYDLSYCLLYTSPSPRDKRQSRMPSSA